MDRKNRIINILRMKAFMAGLGIGMIGIGITAVYYQAEVMERDQRIEHLEQIDVKSFQWQWDREKEQAYCKRELRDCRSYMEGCYDGYAGAWKTAELEACSENMLELCREQTANCK